MAKFTFFRGAICFCLIMGWSALFADLNSQLNTLLQRQSAHFKTSVYVTNAQTNQVLYDNKGANPMTPASNTKLLTSAAAFLYLGADQRYTTSISSSAPVAPILNGNVYITFSGDPSLTTGAIYSMVKDLRNKGVRAVKGNIVLDETVFSGPYYGLGWSQDDLAYCYAAPVSGSIINSNCMALQVLKKKRGKSLQVHQFTTRFPVLNNLHLMTRRDLRSCLFQPTITSNNTILLQGCLPSRASWSFAFAVRNPEDYARQVMQTAFSRAGIRVQGKFVMGKTPGNAKVIASHSSSSLQVLMAHMLKHSDNVYAGALTKTLGENYYGVGTYKAGSNAISAILSTRIHNFKLPYLEDGSGLSTYNLISSKQLVQVLNYMYAQPILGKIFIKSLAISGQSGTLVSRFTRKGLAGHVFGKTGTIQGVSTLSGYIIMPGSPPISFAIMMNGINGSVAHARSVQNQIVEMLATYFK